ncbi:MAG TPA: hypothetical protein DCS42_12950 [Nitrospiraceae bacterium]|nr:hypothetical protein [Nitrospiraceae bacterium]
MKTIFDNQKIELKCECGRKFKETIGRLKKNPSIKCPCGITIKIEADQLAGKLDKAQSALDNIPKNITIKL